MKHVPVIVERVESDADFVHVHRLMVEYERDLPPDLRHGREPSLEEVRREYSGENAAFVARFGGEPGGCAAVTRFDGTTMVLKRVYVQPAHRGKGGARALTMAAVDFARSRGYERIVLDTEAERLSAAYALYRSLGFVECAPYGPVDYACPTYMELRLREHGP